MLVRAFLAKKNKGNEMADTLNDITVPTTAWVSANTLSGITVGNPMVIQSKGDNILCQINTTQPVAGDVNGIVLLTHTLFSVATGEHTCWLKATNKSSPVSVQHGPGT